MFDCGLDSPADDGTPIHLVDTAGLDAWLVDQPPATQSWLDATGYTAEPGKYRLIPNAGGGLEGVVCGVDPENPLYACADLPAELPKGRYFLAAASDPATLRDAALGFGLGWYRFGRYRNIEPPAARLSLPGAETDLVDVLSGIFLTRDLINTPAEDMMPENLAAVCEQLAAEFGARFSQIVDDKLLSENLPAIHAVGRASSHRPRLLDLTWGDESAPKLTLVGKGVCFDSGGLDLKSAAGMRLMKKDMGGSAHVLGLARLVMTGKLPVRLRVLVPAVENAVSGNAYRPGDVIRTRHGMSVEIDNTDAEGRIVLCDALSLAQEESPDLIVDFATLTGAARVALGTELPAMFTRHDTLAASLAAISVQQQDPVWRLPLFAPYRDLLDSKIADISNASNTPFGGAITAALFLGEFVPDAIPWMHFDIMGWNQVARPGRPIGGEAMALRAVYRLLVDRYT